MRGRLILGALSTLTLMSGTAAAQGKKLGWLAKSKIAAASSEAKKWKSDAYLFQVSSYVVTDGVSMWDYDFYSSGASGKKCLRVSFGTDDKAHTSQEDCGATVDAPLKELAVDSDKAVEIARKEGLKKPNLIVALSVGTTPAGARAIWSVMEGSKPGDIIVDIDAMTGAVRSKTKM